MAETSGKEFSAVAGLEFHCRLRLGERGLTSSNWTARDGVDLGRQLKQTLHQSDGRDEVQMP